MLHDCVEYDRVVVLVCVRLLLVYRKWLGSVSSPSTNQNLFLFPSNYFMIPYDVE